MTPTRAERPAGVSDLLPQIGTGGFSGSNVVRRDHPIRESVEQAFARIVRMRLPTCYDDLLVEIDPNMLRVPQVLDELGRSLDPAPLTICYMLGLRPGSTFRRAVLRYRESVAPATPQPKQTGLHYRKRKRKIHRLRLIPSQR